MTITNHQAAALLGARTDEIHSVEETPAGDMIVTTDGTAMVVVPDDRPDAEGKTGLMYLVAPTENYRGTYPVYANPDLDGEADALREELRSVREVPPPGAGGPVDTERTREIDPPPAANSGDDAAGPSAASAADPAKVDDGAATTAPEPGSDEASGSGAQADGAVNTAVIAEVPSGSSAQVEAWVGTDPGRAKQALAAERAASRPRSGLLAKLEKLAGA